MAIERTGRVLILAGGAAAVAFLAWYVFRPSGEEPPKSVEEARADLAKSDAPPEVLAEAVAHVGARGDRQDMPYLIPALEHENLTVRARAGAAVTQILGADFFFRADDPPEKRRQAVERIKRHWEAWSTKEPQP